MAKILALLCCLLFVKMSLGQGGNLYLLKVIKPCVCISYYVANIVDNCITLFILLSSQRVK